MISCVIFINQLPVKIVQAVRKENLTPKDDSIFTYVINGKHEIKHRYSEGMITLAIKMLQKTERLEKK